MVVTGRFRPKKAFACLFFVLGSFLLLSKTVLRKESPSEPPAPETSIPSLSSPITPPSYLPWSASRCVHPQPTLLAIVHSSPSHVLHRKAIRQTWGSDRNSTTRTVFIVGRSNLPRIQQRVQREAEDHNDIIAVDMVDSYRNLTFKHIAALQWGLANCPDVSVILKADDDALVDVPRAMNVLNSTFSGEVSNDVIACRVVPEGTSPRRSGKWKVTRNEYPYLEYPEYCSGLGYFSKPSTLRKVFRAAVSGKVPYLWIDDVFLTGFAAEQAGVKRLDLGVWFARTEEEVIKWMRNGNTKKPMPWIMAEMTPRHWPVDAIALWRRTKEMKEK